MKNQDPHAEGCAAGSKENNNKDSELKKLLNDIKSLWNECGFGDNHEISDPLYSRLTKTINKLEATPAPKLKYMKLYRHSEAESFEVENIDLIDAAIGQFAPEDQADLKKRFLAGEFTKEIPLKSPASYVWTEPDEPDITDKSDHICGCGNADCNRPSGHEKG